MKAKIEDNKKLKIELKRMIDESNQICRILDKDDVNVELINQIGKKTYLKTPSIRRKNLLPNLIYHQGQLNNLIENENKKNKINFKSVFGQFGSCDNKVPQFNKFNYTNYFGRKTRGINNNKIINGLLISRKFDNTEKNKKMMEREENKEEIKKKLDEIAPDIMEKRKLINKRIPLYIKKYKKNYEYINNQIILDDINEKRYVKYDDAFLYSMNYYPSNQICPEYKNKVFKYQKSKIRDYFYRNTCTSFHSNKKEYPDYNSSPNLNQKENQFRKSFHYIFI